MTFVRVRPTIAGEYRVHFNEPVWARNGRELFYRNGGKMMVTAVETQPRFAASKPKLLFEGHYETGLFSFEPESDVSPGGQRFLTIKGRAQESAATQLNRGA